jgi:hypothetical protein
MDPRTGLHLRVAVVSTGGFLVLFAVTRQVCIGVPRAAVTVVRVVVVNVVFLVKDSSSEPVTIIPPSATATRTSQGTAWPSSGSTSTVSMSPRLSVSAMTARKYE